MLCYEIWLLTCDGRFEVCGVIEMSPLPVHSRTVRVSHTDSARVASTATAQPDGTFCVLCKPGSYQFSVGKLLLLLYSFHCICRSTEGQVLLVLFLSHSAACDLHTYLHLSFGKLRLGVCDVSLTITMLKSADCRWTCWSQMWKLDWSCHPLWEK